MTQVMIREEENGIAVHYLGQAGFLFKRHGITIAVDPYLTDSVDRLPEFPSGFWKRRYAPPIHPKQLIGIDLVLCSHNHLDHIDPGTLSGIFEVSPTCMFAAPPSCKQALLHIGIPEDRIVCLHPFEPYKFESVLISPIAAAHEQYELDEQGYDKYLGYVVEWDGICLYHSGDTIVTEQLIRDLSSFRIDIGFLPINGRDLFRNHLDITGNMNAKEAANLAAQLQFDVIVPMHLDLYLNNGESPAYFTDYLFHHHPGMKYHIFQPGERWSYTKQNRVRKTIVIIGAGKTGRGFVARLAHQSVYEIILIDRSQKLVQRLNEDRHYTIHFFDLQRKPVRVQIARAELADTTPAIEAIAGATIIFTAVGEQNLPQLADCLNQASTLRQLTNVNEPLYVITCENGIAPGDVLLQALESKSRNDSGRILVSESAIFCSTVALNGTRLDIQSESYEELPFDSEHLPGFKKMNGMVEISNFKKLLQQKIYTYNCISACIAYLGAFKGYDWYADAANDADIRLVIDSVIEPLNKAVSKLLDVPLEEQQRFAQSAIQKFSDANIRDDIIRNARDVARKLGPKDRLVVPAMKILELGGSVKELAFVMAAGLHYGFLHETQLNKMLTQVGPASTFSSLSGLPKNHLITEKVDHYYAMLSNIENRENVQFLGMIGV